MNIWYVILIGLCPVSSTYKEEMSAPQAESQITPLTSVACDSSTDKTAHPIPKPHEEPKIQKALNNVEVPKKLLCDPPENQVAHKTRCGECFENPIIIDGDESGAAIPSTRGESPENPNILNMSVSWSHFILRPTQFLISYASSCD